MVMAKLKIAGTWSGIIEAELDEWTVAMLREEVAWRSNTLPGTINLICAGRLLRDDHGVGNPKLIQLGLRNNAKILATRVNADEGKALKEQILVEEQRSSKLSRLKTAVAALAKRHADGSLLVDDYNIELEDQRGLKVNMGSETDQRAIMTGLMLHSKGKQLMRTEQYKDALEVLLMGEEAFSLCDPKLIERIDNIPILQIDMVWCYFMLQDINSFSVAGERLAKAREGIEHSHGKDAFRVRMLQGSRSPELALYLRLELLEGVAAFHSGKLEKSRQAFTSAKEKLTKLEVSDEALSLLISMGYKEYEAKRALKMNEQDVESAINFLVEEREKKAQKQADDIKHHREIRELKKYGKTPFGKAVELQRLEQLVSIGFERELAAEALRRQENDAEKALDDLTNPELNSMLQLDIESKKRKRQQKKMEARISGFVSMGFEKTRVIEAVNSHGSRTEALNALLAQNATAETVSASGTPDSVPNIGGRDGEEEEEERDVEMEDEVAEEVERDVEMEDEVAEEVGRGDAFSDYDIDVTKEGEALNHYFALLDSASNSSSNYE